MTHYLLPGFLAKLYAIIFSNHYDCIAVWLHHGMAVSQYGSITIYDCTTVWQYHGMAAVWLHHGMAVVSLRYGCTTVWQYHGMAVSQYGSITVWLHHGMAVSQYGSMAVSQYGSTIAWHMLFTGEGNKPMRGMA